MATAVCALDDLLPGRGVAALVEGRQVALFRLPDGTVRAVANRDPVGDANVLARGLLGTAGARWYVASPLYKTRFDLGTGECLDDPEVTIDTFEVSVAGGAVRVHTPTSPRKHG